MCLRRLCPIVVRCPAQAAQVACLNTPGIHQLLECRSRRKELGHCVTEAEEAGWWTLGFSSRTRREVEGGCVPPC